jgi:hypothetical protein
MYCEVKRPDISMAKQSHFEAQHDKQGLLDCSRVSTSASHSLLAATAVGCYIYLSFGGEVLSCFDR